MEQAVCVDALAVQKNPALQSVCAVEPVGHTYPAEQLLMVEGFMQKEPAGHGAGLDDPAGQ